jgi:hypothetical protein
MLLKSPIKMTRLPPVTANLTTKRPSPPHPSGLKLLSRDKPAVTPTPVRTEDKSAVTPTPVRTEDKSAVTPTPVRTKAPLKRKRARRSPTPNPTEDKPIDAIVTCSDYMKRDVRYTHLVGEEERMITYHQGIYGKHAPLIVQQAINREPNVFQIARDQIVSGMIAMREAVIRVEETLGEASYFTNERRKREDEKRKRARKE